MKNNKIKGHNFQSAANTDDVIYGGKIKKKTRLSYTCITLGS